MFSVFQEGLEMIEGGQGQDGWREVCAHPRQGRPNLGQPEAPLTAVDSIVSLLSWLPRFECTPCTHSQWEAVCRQR